jgi:hypothetical protein
MQELYNHLIYVYYIISEDDAALLSIKYLHHI